MNNLYLPLSGVENVPDMEKFDRVLQRLERRNPFERCATIAAACNLYWRRSIEEGTDAALIAVHPPPRLAWGTSQPVSCRLGVVDI